MSKMIEVENLCKNYKDIEAVKGINFSVNEGEFFGFLGPNGAGKSTSINIMCTMLKQTSGSVKINGFDTVTEEKKVRENIGIIFQENTLDKNLTAYENLKMHCKYYKIPKNEREERIDKVLEMVALGDKKKKLVNSFSGGMKRRLEIARGMLHNPRVLFLDEPTVGLDPQTKEHIWKYIFELREKEHTTIFLTTHHMEEAEACDRIAIMDHGSLIALDTPRNLKHNLGGDVIELGTTDVEVLREEVKKKYNIDAKVKEDIIRFHIQDGNHFMIDFLKQAEVVINSVNIRQPTLNDVFLNLTGRQMRDE